MRIYLTYVKNGDIIDICQKGDDPVPRPQKSRRICCYPDYWSFAPVGDKANDSVTMSLDEFETIRLIIYQTYRFKLVKRHNYRIVCCILIGCKAPVIGITADTA